VVLPDSTGDVAQEAADPNDTSWEFPTTPAAVPEVTQSSSSAAEAAAEGSSAAAAGDTVVLAAPVTPTSMPPISPRSAAGAAVPGTSTAGAAAVEPQSVFAAAAAALERGGSGVEHTAGSASGSRSGSRPPSTSLNDSRQQLAKRGSSSSLVKAGSQSGTPTPSGGGPPGMAGSHRSSQVTGSEVQEGLEVYAGQLGQVDGLLQPGDADAASTGTGERC
jgi:hypothetical protein